MKNAYVFSDRYSRFDYGPHHPLRIERLRLTYELCRAYGLFDLPDTLLVEAEPADEADILQFHTPGYVEVLKEANRGETRTRFSHGLGFGDNPVFPGLWDWSLLHTGASLQCARLVADRKARIAFNIAGGLHHAMPDRAAGFCYVNDPAVTIHYLLDRGFRVLYLDVDAHHGDGVQWAFYDDPRVLTVSFHQDGRTLFPGTGGVGETGTGRGVGYTVNVPLYPGTDDAVFLAGFRRLVPVLVEKFKPQVVVSQLGVDTFADDPLARLDLTTNGFCEVVRYLTDTAPAWVALGGGGYDLYNVARSWTLAWAIMNRVELDDELPIEMVDRLRGLGGSWLKLRDRPYRSHDQDECRHHLEAALDYLEREVIGLIRSDSGSDRDHMDE